MSRSSLTFLSPCNSCFDHLSRSFYLEWLQISCRAQSPLVMWWFMEHLDKILAMHWFLWRNLSHPLALNWFHNSWFFLNMEMTFLYMTIDAFSKWTNLKYWFLCWQQPILTHQNHSAYIMVHLFFTFCAKIWLLHVDFWMGGLIFWYNLH